MVTKDTRPARDPVPFTDPAGQEDRLGLIHRPRRLRGSAAIRDLVRETRWMMSR